jgi:hypothetical protein
MRQVVRAIGGRGLYAREHEPEGNNEEGEGELHKRGDLTRNRSARQASAEFFSALI